MQPSDPTVDPDADPTRVRPDRQGAADLPEDRDADPTRVRPRATSPWGEPARPESRTDASEVPPVEGPPPWTDHRYQPEDGYEDRGYEDRGYPDHGYADRDAEQYDPDGAPTTVLTVAHDSDREHRRRDWAWVEEWRAERSAPAWGPGIAVGVFVALMVAVALVVLTSGVSDSPILAIVFNVTITAGMAPALWLCRPLPVLRFLAAGAAAGLLFGWIALIFTL